MPQRPMQRIPRTFQPMSSSRKARSHETNPTKVIRRHSTAAPTRSPPIVWDNEKSSPHQRKRHRRAQPTGGGEHLSGSTVLQTDRKQRRCQQLPTGRAAASGQRMHSIAAGMKLLTVASINPARLKSRGVRAAYRGQNFDDEQSRGGKTQTGWRNCAAARASSAPCVSRTRRSTTPPPDATADDKGSDNRHAINSVNFAPPSCVRKQARTPACVQHGQRRKKKNYGKTVQQRPLSQVQPLSGRASLDKGGQGSARQHSARQPLLRRGQRQHNTAPAL